MSDCNQEKVIIEIPKHSRLKYEIDKKTGRLSLDRILHGSCFYPYSYGYIEETLDGDGDPMDVVVLSQESFFPGTEVPVRIIGSMKMIDGGDRDNKLIGVVSVDPRYDEWKELSDVPQAILREIEDFFRNYKNLEKKEVITDGFIDDLSEIKRMIKEGKELFVSKNK